MFGNEVKEAAVLLSEAGPVVVVRLVIVESDLTGSGSGDWGGTTIEDGVVGKHDSRSLRRLSLDVCVCDAGSGSLLPGWPRKASMIARSRIRHEVV